MVIDAKIVNLALVLKSVISGISIRFGWWRAEAMNLFGSFSTF